MRILRSCSKTAAWVLAGSLMIVSASGAFADKKKEEDAVKGALIGAGVGALVGDGKGAAAGAVVGAIIGANKK
ncbi:MAG: YMGG-like glycine zipper-containing protein [Ruegeria sp.]